MSDNQANTGELDYVHGEIRAEISLLNSRLNALISSQSFLVIAYGSLIVGISDSSPPLFSLTLPPFIALLGAVLVWEARPGLWAAQEAIRHWREREAEIVDADAAYNPYTLATDNRSRARVEKRQQAGMVFSKRAPIILLVAWTVFLIMPFVLWRWG